MKYVNIFWTRQEILDLLEGSVKCYSSMAVWSILLSTNLSCGTRRAYKIIEEKLINTRTLEDVEMLKQAKEPRAEEKARKQFSDKMHGVLLCTELSTFGLSYNGVNMSNG